MHLNLSHWNGISIMIGKEIVILSWYVSRIKIKRLLVCTILDQMLVKWPKVMLWQFAKEPQSKISMTLWGSIQHVLRNSQHWLQWQDQVMRREQDAEVELRGHCWTSEWLFLLRWCCCFKPKGKWWLSGERDQLGGNEVILFGLFVNMFSFCLSLFNFY